MLDISAPMKWFAFRHFLMSTPCVPCEKNPNPINIAELKEQSCDRGFALVEMAAVSSAAGEVGLFELCNPHLLPTDLLQVTS